MLEESTSDFSDGGETLSESAVIKEVKKDKENNECQGSNNDPGFAWSKGGVGKGQWLCKFIPAPFSVVSTDSLTSIFR